MSLPSVSVVMPVRNGGAVLRRALAMVHRQDYTGGIELLALDSGSTDGSIEALEAAGARILRMDATEFDWGAARERLFSEARGSIFVNLSQDAVPVRTDWIGRLTAPLEDPAIGAVSGSSWPDPERGFPQFAWERNGRFYFTREIAKFRKRFGRGFSLANAAVRRTAWEQLHIDPQPTGEDFQLQQKLAAAGWQIAFPEDAPVLHHHYYRLRALWRRCRNEGLALRLMGCVYHEGDLLCDLLRADLVNQWAREIRYGRLKNGGEWLFPWVRPLAVYVGSRWAQKYRWY